MVRSSQYKRFMITWRGAGSDTSDRAERLRTQRWSDPRLVLGVLLVLAATVLGASVVSAGDRTEAYWALAGDVRAGDAVQRGDLVETRARVDDDAARSLLRTDDELPAELATLTWSRDASEGALVDRALLGGAESTGQTQLPLVVRLGAAPDDLRRGEQVDVWVGPSPEDSGSQDEAYLVLQGVPVVDTGSVRGAGGSRTVLVDVSGTKLQGDVVAALTARHVTLVRNA